jgi:hypothetical protein
MEGLDTPSTKDTYPRCLEVLVVGLPLISNVQGIRQEYSPGGPGLYIRVKDREFRVASQASSVLLSRICA